MRVLIIASLLTALPLAAAHAQAPSEPSDIEEARKEIRILRSRIQQAKSALSESAEFDRMSAAAANRASKILEGEAVPTVERAAPELPARPALPTAPAVASGRRKAVVAPTIESTGVIRGKVSVPSGEPVAYVFVENIRGPAVGGKVTIEQVRKQFVPSWAVVQRGTTIGFPNMDSIYHNVFSLSTGNSFDLGLYAAGAEAKTHTFNDAGGVDIHCNIHPQMAASVLVVPNRYFAKVKADGTYELTGVPAGKRKIAIWAPGSQISSEWIELPGGGTADLNLKLESKNAAHTRKDGRPYGSYE